MIRKSILSDKQRGLLEYLIEKAKNPSSEIPSIQKISADLGISTACLREQIELAKNLGIITAQPRKGIEILPYQFKPAVIKSLFYAVNLDLSYFYQFSELRNHLEKAYFFEAVQFLDGKTINELKSLVNEAQQKLEGNPVQIPHSEHRNFHLLIYLNCRNVFLYGFLEAYWDMYEQIGLNLYNNLEYLFKVWNYHKKIAEKLALHKFENAYQLLVEHMELIDKRQ